MILKYYAVSLSAKFHQVIASCGKTDIGSKENITKTELLA